MLEGIRGTAAFKAEGEDIYKFINSIRENNIICTNQHCRDGIFFGKVYRRDIESIQKLADECGVRLEVTAKKGMSFKVFAYRMRFGIAAGAIVLLCFVIYLSNIVVTIEVCGNTQVTEAQIISALAEIGIYKGRLIADIDFAQCEKKLRLSIPDIAWTGIRHTGSRIVVDITEIVEPPEMINDDIPCNIVAAKDAQLTYAQVYSGKLVKKIGDGIKKGDMIVSGVFQDENGHILKKHSMGEIKGIYKEEYVFEQPFAEETQVYTGEEITKRYLEFFGFRIPLFINSQQPEAYDYSESTGNFMILGKQLPMGLVSCRYTPFVYKITGFDSREADEKLQQKVALFEKNFYDSSEIEIIERKITTEVSEDKLSYKVEYTLEGDIGVDSEIYVKK